MLFLPDPFDLGNDGVEPESLRTLRRSFLPSTLHQRVEGGLAHLPLVVKQFHDIVEGTLVYRFLDVGEAAGLEYTLDLR